MMNLKKLYLAKQANSGKKKLSYIPAPDNKVYLDTKTENNSYVPTSSFVEKKISSLATPKKTLTDTSTSTSEETTKSVLRKPFVSSSKHKYKPIKEEIVYSDNARIATPVSQLKQIVKFTGSKAKEDFNKIALQKMQQFQKANGSEKDAKRLEDLRAKQKANPNVDYTLVVDQPFMDLNDPEQVKKLYESPSLASKALDILPTNLSFFARGALGMNNTTGNLPDKHLQELGYAISSSKKRKQTSDKGFDGSFGYDDFRNGRKDYNDAATNNKVVNTTEVADLQTSIGQARYKTLPNGDVVVADNYNFDEYAKSPKNIYQAGEVVGAKMGINTQTYIVVPKNYINQGSGEDVQKEESTNESIKSTLSKVYKTAKNSANESISQTSSKPAQPIQPTTKQPTVKQTNTFVKKEVEPTATKSLVADRIIKPAKKSLDTTVTPTTPSTSTLHSEESKVAKYQTMLNNRYSAGLESDGAWGPKTQAAYEKYILKR